jgi:hypothetical protein
LVVDVLWKAKPVSAFAYTNFPDFSRPSVDVLKKMMMDRFVVCGIEISFGQGLCRAL